METVTLSERVLNFRTVSAGMTPLVADAVRRPPRPPVVEPGASLASSALLPPPSPPPLPP